MRMMRIGELAQAAGVSAKALRLYEARDLLRPCAHSVAGYRLYGSAALKRLQQILVLRRAGFSLTETGRLLHGPGDVADQLFDQRITRLRAELASHQHALHALETLRMRLHSASSIDQLLECLHMSQQLDVSFTEAERTAFKARAEALGSATIEAAELEWPQLIAAVRAAMDHGTPASDPAVAAVAALARRWQQLVQMASGGDAAVERKIATAWQAQPQQMAANGLDPALFAYVGAAAKAVGDGN